ncbi:MAG: hypothetical protein QNL90_13890 [Gammaproteobacteria bacterium]|nr:hypothetical protein [Gammaproteobacteria bacterium]MDX2461228.1 hypothetical protein [Gammaproteobacteria bacterium]
MSRGSKTFPEMWRAEGEWKLENHVQVRGKGVLALSAGPTLIGLLPPLTISQDAIGVVIARA